ncbi:MAG: hypothetical protein IJX47_08295 [Clostridia bacterium]|nr:hypothetical protein [Clostridia bacterium]
MRTIPQAVVGAIHESPASNGSRRSSPRCRAFERDAEDVVPYKVGADTSKAPSDADASLTAGAVAAGD